MKLRIFGIMILMVFCFGIVSAYAEEPKDQMFFILDVAVSPSTANAYETAHKAWMSAHAKYNYPIGYTAYKSNDSHYYYAIPISSFADIDNFIKADNEFIEKIGKKKTGVFT